MATPIPGAYPSPRIDKGVLRWYEGDTFEITLHFELQDQDGEDVTMGTTDSVSVEFLDDTRQTVHTFSFDSVEDNRVKLTRGNIHTTSGTRTETRRRWRGTTGRLWNEVRR